MTPVRIILRFTGDVDDATRQVVAATTALRDGLQPGGLYGITVNGRAYGVKRNDAGSVSVYPPDAAT